MNIHSKSDEGPKRLRDRLREATTSAILAAAEDAFAASGFASARMEDVASRAGVSVGTLYNYFEDRQALLGALLDGRRQELIVRLDAALDEGKGSPFDAQLERFVGTFLDHFDTHRRFFAIVMQGDRPAGAKEASVVTAPSAATMRLVTERFEKLVRRGQREHALRSGEPAFLATLLVGMARAVLLRSLARGDDAPTAPLAKSIADVFLHGAAS